MNQEMQNSEIENEVTNTIKVGKYLELQTRSFWLGLVGILAIFMAILLFMNYYFNQKTINSLIELNKQSIQVIQTFKEDSQNH